MSFSVQIIEHSTNGELVFAAVVAAAIFTVALRAVIWASWRIVLAMIAMIILALIGGYAIGAVGDAGWSVVEYLKGTGAAWKWMADKVFAKPETVLAGLVTIPITWIAISMLVRS